MATQIKAIETLYNGIHYRSRLEARWAVFFDEIGLCHSYEPAAFRYSGYVPDFSLESRNLTVLVETKPTFEYVFNAKDKFIDYLLSFVSELDEETNTRVVSVYGLPGSPCSKEGARCIPFGSMLADALSEADSVPFLLHCAACDAVVFGPQVVLAGVGRTCFGWTEYLEKAAQRARGWRFS